MNKQHVDFAFTADDGSRETQRDRWRYVFTKAMNSAIGLGESAHDLPSSAAAHAAFDQFWQDMYNESLDFNRSNITERKARSAGVAAGKRWARDNHQAFFPGYQPREFPWQLALLLLAIVVLFMWR